MTYRSNQGVKSSKRFEFTTKDKRVVLINYPDRGVELQVLPSYKKRFYEVMPLMISLKGVRLLENMYKNGKVYATDMQQYSELGIDFISGANKGMRDAVYQLNEAIKKKEPELSGDNRLIVSAGHAGGWKFNQYAEIKL